eukprot:TRINITY_DN23752_c0_g1_i1.p1 TRINITY_DN23752_c0_g1~~TRINITY_DN23752_c0_g1_i1.p1  ORF type:complete len:2456 (+),score=487.41 TRINITY_DN23752_c0_g1_i1:313-7368(+)
MDFPKLEVLSTDQTFRRRDDRDGAVKVGQSMYKLLQLQDLGIRMSPAGSQRLDQAEYVVSPISASLQLAHEPAENVLRVKLMVATEEVSELSLRRSQVKHLRSIKGDLNDEAHEHYRLLVSEVDEKTIYKDAAASIEEYSMLYERFIIRAFNISSDASGTSFSPQDEKRKQLLEDALSARLLARARWKTRKKVEALHEEVARRQSELEKARRAEERSKSGGLFKRLWARRSTAAPDEGETEAKVLLSAAERNQLLSDFQDTSKVEHVDLPQRFSFEFVLGQMALDLIDDRHFDEVPRQLLSLALREAQLQIDVGMAMDYRGQDSAEWKMKIKLGSFHALHHAKSFMKVTTRSEDALASSSLPQSPWLTPTDTISAATFVIENKLQKEMNLLEIVFDFMPVEIHMLQGIAEMILEFWRAPARELTSEGSAPASSAGDTQLQVEETLEMTKQWLEANKQQAKQLALAAYDRIPDKIQLEIRIASPILNVPVPGLGTAVFSLGLLHIMTPSPCEYGSIDLGMQLNDTTLRATSVRDEHFDMIQPVPVNVTVEYRGLEDRNCVNVQMEAEEVKLSLAPQALQILLATPSSAVGILDDTSAVDAAPAPVIPKLQRQTTAAGRELARLASQVFKAAADTKVDGSEQDDQGNAEGRKLIRKASDLANHMMGPEKTQSLVEAARERVEKVRSKQFILNLSMMFDAIDIILADSIVPIMRWRAELMPPGLVMYKQREPNLLTLNVANLALEVESLNPKSGVWEPFAERTHLGMEVERKLRDDHRDMHVIISGHTPALLNVTPTMVTRVSYIMPLFIESVTASSLIDTKPQQKALSDKSVVKYRVINLCGKPIELNFASPYKNGLTATVQPTGSEWKSLDKWILPHFSTALTAQVSGSAASEFLSLERSGAVAIPSSGCVAELLTPSPSHRLLLLAPPLRVHNQTDLPMIIRFHDAAENRVLMVDLLESCTCEASLLGISSSKYVAKSHYSAATSQLRPSQLDTGIGEILLQPNTLCAVTPMALFRAQQAQTASPQTCLSVRPAGLEVDFSVPAHAGAGVKTCALFCRGPEDQGSTAKGISSTAGVHFLCNSTTFLHPLPSPTTITTVALQPTLAILNAIPMGELNIRYTTKPSDNRFLEATQAKVPSFTRWHVYSFRGVGKDGLALIARLEGTAPWSEPATFSYAAFRGDVGDAGQMMHIRQRTDGAAAGVLVEPLSHNEIRLACPNWFVDRSGLSKPLQVELRHHGRPLPRQGGLTLLPAECLEEKCELKLRGGTGASGSSSLEFRVPPNFCVLPWRTPAGPYVFCIQAEDLDLADMHGAQCQVLTLRPRMVLTNAASCNLEVRLGEKPPVRLAPGDSMEHHWEVPSSEVDAPRAQLHFRPLRNPPCGWSGTVICSDETAGSTPFELSGGAHQEAMPSARSAGREMHSAEIWSAEVAPARGAVAVSFKEGSDYRAANHSTRQDVSMEVRPVGLDESIASHLVAAGEEKVFGWSQPHAGTGGHSLEVTLRVASTDQRIAFKVQDVRKTSSQDIPKLNLRLSSGRTAAGTLLSLEDMNGAHSTGPRPQGVNSKMHVEVKFGRVGVSVVEEFPRTRELLFWKLDLLRLDYKKDSKESTLNLAISDSQVDCQLPDRCETEASLRRSDETVGGRGHERPAVILANCADGGRAFLTVLITRGVTSSSDIVLPFCQIALDTLDLTIDDGWLDPFLSWLAQLREAWTGRNGIRYAAIAESAGRSILQGYDPPNLPAVIQVDCFKISEVNLTAWCALKLRTVRFLPQFLRTAIRVLSFSGQLTLDGASLKLEERKLPPHRGSLPDFLRSLGNEYTMNIVSQSAGLLGKSSVLNLPRVPLRIGMTGISYISDTFGLAAGEAASLLNTLTFDDDYVARQRQIRQAKSIQGMGDGFAEAGKALADGVESMLDVIKEPLAGAERDGVGGFFSGLGRGLVGSFVKPVAKMGQAISDVGSGIAHTISPDSHATKRRRRRCRARHPRLIFGELGVLRPYSELEAELKWQLGDLVVHGIEEVLPLTPPGWKRLLLCLFSTRLVIVELKFSEKNSQAAGLTGSGQASSSSSSLRPEKEDSRDIFNAVDDSATRLFQQALKPINTVVYGVQELETSFGGSSSSVAKPRPEVLKHAVKGECKFSNIKAIHSSSVGGFQLKIEDKAGNTYKLPMSAASLGQKAWEALAAGFDSAVKNSNGIANWDKLRAALREDRASREAANAAASDALDVTPSSRSRGVGQRTLEVLEAERFQMVYQQWGTAHMPQDWEMRWRWLDSTGHRHPHIIPNISREECAARTKPPVELDRSLYQPASDWKIEIGPNTDSEGWTYGMSWKSSQWEAKQGLFDHFRKRRWTRTYR